MRKKTEQTAPLREQMFFSLNNPRQLVVWCREFVPSDKKGIQICKMDYPFAGIKGKRENDVVAELKVFPLTKDNEPMKHPDPDEKYSRYTVYDFNPVYHEKKELTTMREKNLINFAGHLLESRVAEAYETPTDEYDLRLQIDIDSVYF